MGTTSTQPRPSPFALPRPGGVTTIYRAPDREPTLDVVGVSSTDVHNFGPVMHTFHSVGGASDSGLGALTDVAISSGGTCRPWLYTRCGYSTAAGARRATKLGKL